MSILLFCAFIMAMSGSMPMEYFTEDVFYTWGLFSIADALWIGLFFKK